MLRVAALLPLRRTQPLPHSNSVCAGSLAARLAMGFCRKVLKRMPFMKSRASLPPIRGRRRPIGWSGSALPSALQSAGVDALAAARNTPSTARPWVLWCWPRSLGGEFGSPSAAGGPSAWVLIRRVSSSSRRRERAKSPERDRGGPQGPEPRRRHWCPRRGGTDAGAPAELSCRRNGDAVSPHHASGLRACRRDSHAMAREA